MGTKIDRRSGWKGGRGMPRGAVRDGQGGCCEGPVEYAACCIVNVFIDATVVTQLSTTANSIRLFRSLFAAVSLGKAGLLSP